MNWQPSHDVTLQDTEVREIITCLEKLTEELKAWAGAGRETARLVSQSEELQEGLERVLWNAH